MNRRPDKPKPKKIVEEELGQARDYSRVMVLVLIVAGGVSGYALLMANLYEAPELVRLSRNSLIAFGLALLWHLFSRRWGMKSISMVMTLGFIGIASYSAFNGMGVRGTAYTLFLLIVMISALFVSSRAAYFVATAGTLVGFGLIVANEAGLMPNSTNDLDDVATWIIMSGFFFVAAITLNTSKRQTEKALDQYRNEIKERERAEAEIQRLNVDLERRIEERTTQLIESEERYRLITMVTSDYVFSTKVFPDGTIQENWLAGAFEKITGYDIDEYLDQGGWLSILHPDDHQANEITTRKVLQNEVIVQDSRIVHKNGTLKWVRVFAQPIWDEEDGQVKEIYGAVKDISIEKKVDENEKEWRTLLENVIDLGKAVTKITDLDACYKKIHYSIQSGLSFDRVGLFIYDSKKEILEGAYGTTRDGQIEKLHRNVERTEHYADWEVVLSDPSAVMVIDNFHEKFQPSPDSPMFEVKQHLTVAAWAGDQPVALISVDNLISGREITENQINALKLFAGYAGLAIQNGRWNKELEARVERRTIELEDANQELESFSYTMAHDLRTPARAMMGFVEILREDYEDKLDETGQHYLLRISSGSRRMGQMIDHLLDFIRLGRVVLRIQQINLENVIRSIIAEYQVEIEQRKIVVTFNELPPAWGDMILLRQAFSALIDNAIKFTRLEENPKIEIGSETRGNEIVYFIRDNGVGFNMEYADKIFGVFQRLHHVDEFEGVGVGLAVVNRVLKRHNGRGWIESHTGAGTTFYLILGDDNEPSSRPNLKT